MTVPNAVRQAKTLPVTPARRRRATERRARSDYWLFLAVLGLLTIGLLMVYSATYTLGYLNYRDTTYFVRRQFVWALLGLVLLLLLWRFDYRIWQRYTVPLMGGTLAVLLLLLLMGQSVFGAQRWLFGNSVQPAEFAKVTVVLYIAHWASSKGESIRRLDTGLIPFSVLVGVVCGLILLQPDFSTALLIAFTAGVMFFVAGAELAQFVAAGLIALFTIITVTTRADYRVARIQAFLDPFGQADAAGYQITQTLIAMASGGLLGQGLGSSRGNVGVLPAGHTDVILAIVGQELGLVFTLLILALYLFVGYRGFRIGAHAPDAFGTILATGVTTLLLFQALLNVAVVTNTVPFTGITLPFISYGGSSLVTSLVSVGLLLSISRAEPIENEES